MNQWICGGFMPLLVFHWYRSHFDCEPMHLNYKPVGPNSIKDRWYNKCCALGAVMAVYKVIASVGQTSVSTQCPMMHVILQMLKAGLWKYKLIDGCQCTTIGFSKSTHVKLDRNFIYSGIYIYILIVFICKMQCWDVEKHFGQIRKFNRGHPLEMFTKCLTYPWCYPQ